MGGVVNAMRMQTATESNIPQGNYGGRPGLSAESQAVLPGHDSLIFDPNESVTTKQQKFLQNMAYFGGGPSAAQVQMNQGLGKALAQSQALARSQRGVSPALAARLAMQANAQMQTDALSNSALMRQQEQLGALNMLQGQTQLETGYAQAQMQAQAQKDMANKSWQNAAVGGLAQGIGAAMAGGGKFAGGVVPGQAEVDGDSAKNDKVHTMLSPGEIVLPRSVTQGPNVEEKAVEFLKSLKANKKGYDKVVEAKKMWGGGKC